MTLLGFLRYPPPIAPYVFAFERSVLGLTGLLAVTLSVHLMIPATGWADVVYLVNGSRMVVDGWQEGEEEALELRVRGGWVTIAKADVTKIEEGAPLEVRTQASVASSGDDAPAAPPPRPRLRLSAAEALPRLRALLRQGELLFADRVLTPAQKARAAQWLDDRWREMDVPATLGEAYGRGARAMRLLVDALASAGDPGSEAAERLDEAALAVREAGAGLPAGVVE